jgi:hypothetical protein
LIMLQEKDYQMKELINVDSDILNKILFKIKYYLMFFFKKEFIF